MTLSLDATDLAERGQLQRWGHASATCSTTGLTYVFGGYGSLLQCNRERPKRCRLQDIIVLDCKGMPVLPAPAQPTDPPSRRERHTLCSFGECQFLLFGGRVSPKKPLGDAFVLKTADPTNTHWIELRAREGSMDEWPCARWSHTANTVAGEQYVLLFGGRSQDTVFGDLWRLDYCGDEAHSWTRVASTGSPPSPRFEHASITLPGTSGGDGAALLIHGGLTSIWAHADQCGCTASCHLLDLKTLTWSTVASYPQPRYSHASITVGVEDVLIVGGVCPLSAGTAATPLLLSRRRVWKPVETAHHPLLLRHTLIKTGTNEVVSVGGGVQCAFVEAVYSPSLNLRLNRCSGRLVVGAVDSDVEKESSTLGAATDCRYGIVTPPGAARCTTADTKACKIALEQVGWYDKTRRIARDAEVGWNILPLTASGVVGIHSFSCRSEDNAVRDNPLLRLELVVRKYALPKAKHLLNYDAKGNIRASLLMHAAKCGFELSATAVAKTPDRFERVADVVLVRQRDFSDAEWIAVRLVGESDPSLCLWCAVARAAAAQRVVLAAEVDPLDDRRRSRARQVYPALKDGSNGRCWVEVRQNGVLYGWDLTRCMFSSGNISEKMRVATFQCEGETVVDLYAGIGYFTLPYLVHTGCVHLHACEWNHDAVEALRWNLKANGVESRCTVYEGDNRAPSTVTKLRGIADRVNLGLLPSSEDGWVVGVECLKAESGGLLHVHENVGHGDEGSFVKRLCAEVLRHCRERKGGKAWEVECTHLEHVKSYAPRVDHIVVTLRVQPANLPRQSV